MLQFNCPGAVCPHSICVNIFDHKYARMENVLLHIQLLNHHQASLRVGRKVRVPCRSAVEHDNYLRITVAILQQVFFFSFYSHIIQFYHTSHFTVQKLAFQTGKNSVNTVKLNTVGRVKKEKPIKTVEKCL